MALHQPLLFDVADAIEQFLGAAHRKGGDDHVAAPVKGVLEHGGELPDIIGMGAVQPVAIGGFDHHHVGGVRLFRVADQRPVHVAQIAGEEKGPLLVPFGHGNFYGGGTQKMPGVPKLHGDAFGHLYRLMIPTGLQLSESLLRIGGGVHRHIRRLARPLIFAVAPLGFEFLNMGGIHQHNAAQLRRGLGGVDGAGKALCHQLGNLARVVDMGVGEQYHIHLPRRDRQVAVFVNIPPLLHTAVDENTPLPYRQQGAGAGHFVGRS